MKKEKMNKTKIVLEVWIVLTVLAVLTAPAMGYGWEAWFVPENSTGEYGGADKQVYINFTESVGETSSGQADIYYDKNCLNIETIDMSISPFNWYTHGWFNDSYNPGDGTWRPWLSPTHTCVRLQWDNPSAISPGDYTLAVLTFHCNCSSGCVSDLLHGYSEVIVLWGDPITGGHIFHNGTYTCTTGAVDDNAIAEETVKGNVIVGSYKNTTASGNDYEAIEEIVQGPRSVLEHEWTINVTGGSKTNVTFHLEANRTESGDGDKFKFSYSTDGSTYHYMLTVTNTSDTNTYQTYELPKDTSGNVTIQVIDTDRERGNKTLDTIYIDHMFIRSVLAPPSYGVEVTIEQASQAVAPGNSTTYNVTVTNTGDFNASYTVNMSGTAVDETTIGVNPLTWNTGILAPNEVNETTVTVSTTLDTNETTYNLTATATCVDDPDVKDSDTSDLVVSSAGYTDDKAIAEETVKGERTGSYTDTYESDNVYESIKEIVQGQKSLLEHKWTIDVTGGNKVTFYVEANHSVNIEGDDFEFTYSTDGSTYTPMVTVTKIDDDDKSQTYELPPDTSGAVYIRVEDTNRKNGNNALDTIYIDHMFIRSESGTPEPGVMHVDDITMWNTSKGPNYKIYTQVKIVDANNAQVAGATAGLNTTLPDGVTNVSSSGITDGNGLVTFMYGPTKETGTYTSTVTNVTKADWDYNQTANVKTSETHTI